MNPSFRFQFVHVLLRFGPATTRWWPNAMPFIQLAARCMSHRRSKVSPKVVPPLLVHLVKKGVDVVFSVRCVLLIPFGLISNRIKKDAIVDCAKFLNDVRVCRRTLPNNLIAKVCCSENFIEQQPQIVARSRIAMQIETASFF